MNARLPHLTLESETHKDSTVFTSGNSQAVRIPKEFQFKTKQVKIIQRGNELVIRPKHKTSAQVLANLPPIDPQDLHEWEAYDKAIRDLRDEPQQERDWNALFGEDSPARIALEKSPRAKKPAARADKSLKPLSSARKAKGAKTS